MVVTLSLLHVSPRPQQQVVHLFQFRDGYLVPGQLHTFERLNALLDAGEQTVEDLRRIKAARWHGISIFAFHSPTIHNLHSGGDC